MSPRRKRILAALAGGAVLLAVLVIAGRSVSRPEGNGVPQGLPGPVLIVPGYGGSTATVDTLARALRAGGRTASVVGQVADGTRDLREQARRVNAAADAAIAAGAPSVDVVGYSAGGVVARIWADELGGASRARRVVTLGSPHHGTEVAQLGAALAPSACPEACRQLIPGSDLLDSLEDAPDGPVWVSLWTAQDETVTPPDSARLDGAVNIELQAVCAEARIGHGDLPRDPLVIGLVDRALAPAPLAQAPPPSQCAALRAEGTAALPPVRSQVVAELQPGVRRRADQDGPLPGLKADLPFAEK